MNLLGTVAISQFGDLVRADDGLSIEREDNLPSAYRITSDARIRALYIQTSTPDRAFTVTLRQNEATVHAYNLSSARLPGAELRVWVFGFGEGDAADLLEFNDRSFAFECATPFQVLPRADHHRFVAIEHGPHNLNRHSCTVLITRTPPTAVVTPCTVVIPKNLPHALPAVVTLQRSIPIAGTPETEDALRAACAKALHDERGALRTMYAHARLLEGSIDEARVWALRALVDGARMDTFSLLGDICEAAGDIRAAYTWYELLDTASDSVFEREEAVLSMYEAELRRRSLRAQLIDAGFFVD